MVSSVLAIHDILSGKTRGFPAGLLRLILWPLSIGYRWGMNLRNHLYDRRLRKTHAAGAPVISVGNITAGGTGKTPLVETLARLLTERGLKPVVVSRGYKRNRGADSDEKTLLAANIPGVPHVSKPDRVAAAREAVRRHHADVILMDDGFQHRRLERDLDIVTVDATNPFGYGHMLPRGLLREPKKSLARADVVVITRANLVPPTEPARLEAAIRQLAPDALVVHAHQEVTALVDREGKSLPPKDLRGKHVVAFCGVGNPGAFETTLATLGAQVLAFFAFGDHHRYRAVDLKEINASARGEDADAIVTTQKDAVRIDAAFPWQTDLLVVKIECKLTLGKDAFEERIEQLFAADGGSTA